MDILEDIDELNKLLRITTRPRIKDMLVGEISKLQLLHKSAPVAHVSSMSSSNDAVLEVEPTESISSATNSVMPKPVAVSKSTPHRHYKEITTYAWDQSDKFMKIYVTLNGVQSIDKSKLSVDYTTNSFQLKVEDLNGANYICRVVGLWGKISVADSYHKVKTDTVLLMLKKEEVKTWAYVTEREDKKKSTPKFDEKKDPNEGLMDLLKKMYDDGDEDMKRTIAKAWTESREKKSDEF